MDVVCYTRGFCDCLIEWCGAKTFISHAGGDEKNVKFWSWILYVYSRILDYLDEE